MKKGTNWLINLLIIIMILGIWQYGISEIFFLNQKSKTSSQETEPTQVPRETIPEIQDPSRPGHGLGTCATLTEDTHVVALFVDDEEASWTKEEAEQFCADVIRPGLDFIEKQAGLYNWDIQLKVTPYYTCDRHSIVYDGVFSSHFATDEAGEITYHWDTTRDEQLFLWDIVEAFGHSSYEQMHNSFRQILGAENIVYMFIPKKDGVSYASPDNLINGFAGYETCVVYPGRQDGERNDGRIVASMILRLFGAGFSAESVDGREPTNSVAARLYPHSILFGGYDISCCFVDPYSAYALGWRGMLPPENDRIDVAGDIPQEGDPYRPMYDKGTCRNLAGNILFLTLFVDDAESCWTQGEIDTVYRDIINPGLSYLTEQAQRRGMVLNFDTGYYSTDPEQYREVRYQGTIPEDSYKHKDADVLDQAALSLGFASRVELYESVLSQSGADQVILMVALNKTGRSHAVCDQDDNGNDNVEYFVAFRNHWVSRSQTRPSTIVHETLHLFGAEDLYEEPEDGRRAQRAALAAALFPKDIMFTEMNNIQYNVLDGYTCYAIGWSNMLPEACTSDAWWADE